MGRRDEAAGYYELAMSHIDQMTEREKGRTRGTYYLMTRNYARRRRSTNSWLLTTPLTRARGST